MRIALVGEGTYPVTRGGVSTWYTQLITGMPEHRFDLVTVVGDRARIQVELPDNVDSTTLVQMWARPPRAKIRNRRRHLRTRDSALADVWGGAVPAQVGSDTDLARFKEGLIQLIQSPGQPLAGLFGRRMSAEVLLSAWHQHIAARPDLPEMTMADAAAAAEHADRILALADRPIGECDLIHLTANGSAAILALAHKWRHGTPLLLTEHGIFLRERYLALRTVGLSWVARYAVMALVRALCRLTYAEADLIAPVSHFNATWAAELGAPTERITTIHNGVDLEAYPALDSEPNEPTVAWVGRVDPLKDLGTLIDAFDLVRREHPRAKLRLFGPTPPENVEYRTKLERRIGELGLTDQVSFEGPVDSSSDGFAAGQVVALSSISEGLPFGVIEAMMSARPSVNTDVGGVAEVVGRDGTAGVLVPPRDPRALAAGLSNLLSDPGKRACVGRAARSRAAELFTLARCIERYRDVYTDLGQAVSPAVHATREHRVGTAPTDRSADFTTVGVHS